MCIRDRSYTMQMLADAEKVALVIAREREDERAPQPLLCEEKGVSDNSNQAVVRMTYPEVMKTLFPEFSFRIGRLGQRNAIADLVNFFIILTSVLVSNVYLLFIANVFSKDPFNVDPDYIILALVIPVGALAQLRSFKYLAFTSVLGDVAVTAGIVGTVVVGLHNGRTLSWPDTDAVKVVNSDFKDVADGVATISFLFLVHIMTLPMAQSLDRDLEEPKRWHWVSRCSYTFIGGLNLVFTLLAVCIFWDDAGGISNPVTDNLGDGAAPAVIKVLLCVDLLFTIPMILSVGREVIENAVVPPQPQGVPSTKNEEITRTIIRLGMTILVLGLAEGATKSSGVHQAFGDAISLVGGLTNTTVGLIVPPFAYHRAMKSERLNGSRIGGFVISLVGLALLGSSTFYTLKNIAQGN
eukprot:TRINITY_DN9519_c0_g1_i3.p1 TRINITY_DN9519_c0_g1~~TRINITY_DN9519_c0_g1_i3.p1  ORF type:complete len:410 (-),score=89.55 TRINITY_DN9519_c0_g1_i3:176-1405(-)